MLCLAVPIGILLGRLLVSAVASPQDGPPPRPGSGFLPGGTIVVPKDRREPLPPLVLGPGQRRAMRSRPMQATYDPTTGMVTVLGAADIAESQPGRYVWSLRAFPYPRGRLHKEHHYVVQAIEVPEGQATFQPEFHDAFVLPPGDYSLELSLYVVSRDDVERYGFHWGKVKFGEDLTKRLSRVSRRARVTVP
jgi:hypothetical protein